MAWVWWWWLVGALLGSGAAEAPVRLAWFVPLTSSAMLQRFHVTVQSIRDTQPADHAWILAVAADEAVHDEQASRAVGRVADEVLLMRDGVKKPLVDYFLAGYAATQKHLADTSTVPGEAMYAVWVIVDVVLLQDLHRTLTVPVGPTQVAVVPTDTSTMYTSGKHFVVAGNAVVWVPDGPSLYGLLAGSGLPHVMLNASFSAKASDLHNYREIWLALRAKGCLRRPRMDAVLCGVTSIFYDMRTFSPWNWWTYPLIRINYPWSLTASHVKGKNIPWYVWVVKVSHFLAMFVVLALSHLAYSKGGVNATLDRIFPEKMRTGPRQSHISWIVRAVFFLTYVALTLLYPEELWPWYGWTVAILWMLVLCYSFLDVLYYPWMCHQGKKAPVVLDANLSLHARRYVEEGPVVMPLELVSVRAKNSYYTWHGILFVGIIGGILVFGYVLGEGRMALVYLAAFMITVLSWFTGFVASCVHTTALASYERGWVERKLAEGDPRKQS